MSFSVRGQKGEAELRAAEGERGAFICRRDFPCVWRTALKSSGDHYVARFKPPLAVRCVLNPTAKPNPSEEGGSALSLPSAESPLRPGAGFDHSQPKRCLGKRR